MEPLKFDREDIVPEIFVHDLDNPEELGGGKDLYMCHVMVQTNSGVTSACNLISGFLGDLKQERKFFKSLREVDQEGFSCCTTCQEANAFEKYREKFG